VVSIQKEYDILVVGGGPAGLASAKGAAEAGARVALFEEHAGIGTPVQCGELFTRSALKEVGMKASKRWLANEFRNIRLVGPGGKEALIELPRDVKPPLFAMERKLWEKDLARMAAGSGASLFSKTTVTGIWRKDKKIKGVVLKHMNKKRKVLGKVIMACDGPGSPIGRKAGLKPYTSPAKYASIAQYQLAGIDIDADVGEVHFHPTPADIFYIIPKGDGYANVGYGCMGSRKKVALDSLKRFITRDKRLAKGSIIEVNVGVEPISGLVDHIADDGIMLIGDAAGMVNPITAAGMRFGLWAGVRGGRIAAKAVADGDPSKARLGELRSMFEKSFGRRFRMMESLRKVLFGLEPKELDEIFDHIGTIKIPAKMFKGKREPLYYPLKMIIGLLVKRPRFLRKFAPLIPMLR